MALKAGTRFEFANSMAQAMEHAFFKEWPNFMGDKAPPSGEQTEQMRLLFIAIAQGVVSYLAKYDHSFDLDLPGDLDGEVRIRTAGTIYYP